MPEIGRPTSNIQNRLNKVSMAEKKEAIDADVLEKISGKTVGTTKQLEIAGSDHNKIGKDEFLKMLSYQLQHQDPMNPVDQNKFAADLAQFAQLEQLTSINKNFGKMSDQAMVEKKALAASFVGKEVVTQGSSIELKADGEDKKILFNLDRESAKVLIRVIDSKGNIAAEIPRDRMSAGSHEIKWDGRGLDKYDAPKGQYSIRIQAWDEADQPIAASTQVTGVVSSVAFEGEEAVLDVSGKKVFLRDVTSFHMPGGDKKVAMPEQNTPVAKNDGMQKKIEQARLNNMRSHNDGMKQYLKQQRGASIDYDQ